MLEILCPSGMGEAGVCGSCPSPGETTGPSHMMVLQLRAHWVPAVSCWYRPRPAVSSALPVAVRREGARLPVTLLRDAPRPWRSCVSSAAAQTVTQAN